MRLAYALASFLLLVSPPAWGAICGDGLPDPGEECDDGNLVSGDGCSAVCVFEGCNLTGTWSGGPLGPLTWSLVEDGAGDIVGVAHTPGMPADALPATGTRTGTSVSLDLAELLLFIGTNGPCESVVFPGEPPFGFTMSRVRTSYCGDGTVDAGEACDDGNFANGDACSAACTLPACGNGVVEPGEACDDGNAVDGDGCSTTCEDNVCGNGVLEPGEQCDDGNTTSGDGCSPTCQLQGCGNGVVESGEQCDDGNTASGDGCSATCVFEGCPLTGTWSGGPFGALTWSLVEDGAGAVVGVTHTPGTPADALPVTGTRVGGSVSLALAEVLPFTGTNGPCDTITFSFPVAFSIGRVRASYCGDGGLDAGEACDDGNFANGDACSAACTLPACGNGVVEGIEQCDDANAVNGDGCSTTCEANVCGNGVPEPGEQCDDGNTANGDGCSPTCQLQGCGNGVVEPGEVCDDGNTVSGDGCSATCVFEGCPLTGTWSGGPGGPMTWSLVEDGAGGIVGVAFTPGAPASVLSIAGTRTGGSVSLTVAGAILFTGANGPCDTIVFSGSFPVAFSIARVRPSYCGDGALDPADEACDDGNFANDACTVACGAPSGCGDGVVAPGEPCDDGNGANTDGCLAGCLTAACGDGWVRAGVETCDDGNAVPGDGCAPDCTLESETSSAAVGGGTLTVTTDTESGGDGATPSDPIETALSAPAGTISGTLTITEETASPTPQPGFVFLGMLVTLDAADLVPTPAASAPLVVTFRIDASQIPGGQDEASILVKKDGATVAPCGGAAGEASPDPCVAARERLADGDVRVTVLTSTLSDWGFAASVCGNAPLLGCRTALPGKAKLKIKDRGGKDVVAWNWRNDLVAPKSLFGDPLAGTDYTLCVYDGTGRVLQLTAPAGGTCGGKACWKPTPSGFRYRNGTSRMVLKAGDARRAKVTTKAGGALALPSLPLAPPVRVQLRPKDGACLDAGFSTPAVNGTRTFRAVGD